MRNRTELGDPSRVLLWDLDGTLVDTGRDIASGVAGMLQERGLAALSVAAVLRLVGQGVRVLVTRCLEEAGRPARDEADLAEGIRQFRAHYTRHLMDTTVPYAGLPRTVGELCARGRGMGVISNKPEDFTRAILEKLGMLTCFRAIVGGDTLPTRKPSAEPLLHALQLCDPSARPRDAIVIGDSITDLRAARAAGMPLCGVGWGFDPEGKLRAADPEWWAETPEELGSWLLADAVEP